MVQELINNAKKHSGASRIRLYLTASQGSTQFEYEDDGVGFNAARTGPNDIGYSGGMGIDHIKSRIYSLNGAYELQTGTGKGVKFKATIPLTKEQMAARMDEIVQYISESGCLAYTRTIQNLYKDRVDALLESIQTDDSWKGKFLSAIFR